MQYASLAYGGGRPAVIWFGARPVTRIVWVRTSSPPFVWTS